MTNVSDIHSTSPTPLEIPKQKEKDSLFSSVTHVFHQIGDFFVSAWAGLRDRTVQVLSHLGITSRVQAVWTRVFPGTTEQASLNSVQVQGGYTPVVDECELPLLNPDLSERKTEKLRLDNGMEILLVSDPGAEQSAAALAVKAGSMDDPEDLPGTAHFLEHMLFMGTDKYPDENDYDVYLNNHGGSYNAYTAGDHTNYIFSVDNDAFEGALDRFSQFFIAPRFNPSGVQREMKAVDKEFSKNIPHDGWRTHQVEKELANPAHPFSHFDIGNLVTLKHISQEALKDWYRKHYSANLMKLSLYSTKPIEEMRALALQKFQAVQNYNHTALDIHEPLLRSDLEGKMVVVEPFKHQRNIELSWELPEKFTKMLESRPDHLVAHVLGDEGPTSLLHQLIQEGAAEGLMAGGQRIGPNNMVFNISIQLTESGLQNRQAVIQRVFDAIAMLKQEGIPEALFDEVQAADRLQYQFRQRSDAYTEASGSAAGLIQEDLTTFPERSYIVSRFDAEATQSLIEHLNVDSCHFTLTAPSEETGLDTDREERWMNVPYGIHDLPEEWLADWRARQGHPAITLPEPNPYTPRNLDVKWKGEKDESLPSPIVAAEGPTGKTYFAQDQRFLTPKVFWDIELRSEAKAGQDVFWNVAGDVFARMLKESLNAEIYTAQSAGLESAVRNSRHGIRLTIAGYHDKAKDLLRSLTSKIMEFSADEVSFENHVEALRRSILNETKEAPHKQAAKLMGDTLVEDRVPSAAKLEALNAIDFNTFKNAAERLLQGTHFQSLLFGNMDEDDAREVHKVLSSTFQNAASDPSVFEKEKVTSLAPNAAARSLTKTTNVNDHATLLLVETGKDTPRDWALNRLIMKAVAEPFFTKLRTKQQTGYIAGAFPRSVGDTLYGGFLVQSNTVPSDELLARFELFIDNYSRRLKDGKQLSEEAFQSLKQGLISEIVGSTNNLMNTGHVLASLAFDKDGDFSRLADRSAAVEALGYEEFVEAVEQLLHRSHNAKRLALRVEGQLDPERGVAYQQFLSVKELREEIQ